MKYYLPKVDLLKTLTDIFLNRYDPDDETTEYLELHELIDLYYIAIYFHSNECIEEFYMSFRRIPVVPDFQIAAVTDNLWFFQKYHESFHSFDDENKYNILAIANMYKSEEVSKYIRDHLMVADSYKHNKTIYICDEIETLNFYGGLIKTMRDLWRMEELSYDSHVQWLPKETVEDQLLLIFYSLKSSIGHL